MKTYITVTVAAVGLMLATTAASAQTAPVPQSPRDRPHQQLGQRLRDGAQSGQLTKGELTRLRARIATVRRHAGTLRAGQGPRTPEQRRAIRREWRQVNQMLFRLRHNRRHR